MESVLVTGGAGFIGSNIAEALLAQGYRVVILDDLSTGKMGNVLGLEGNGNFKFVKGSILESGLLRSLIKTENISLISHQAAIPSVSKSVKDPVKTLETNTMGTANLFHIAAEYGCKRVVYASSSSIYGDTPQLPKTESMSFNPKSPYAISKVTKEMLASVFSDLYGIEVVGLRYFNVYGKKQDPSSDYAAVIPKFITRALKNEPIPIEGDGLQTRDFSYIDDVVHANLAALTQENISRMVFNIACGARISIVELAKKIIEIIGSQSQITHQAPRPGDIRDSLADIESAKKHLHFKPQYDVAKGLEKTVQWFKNNSH
jgi:UDP-glucose 4-epimerase